VEYLNNGIIALNNTSEFTIIPKGEIVTCPNCGIEIAEVIVDLFRYSPLVAEAFKGISQEIIPKDKPECKKCGTYWCDGRLHLKNGWNVVTPNSVKFIKGL